jgi:hypothetical protein
MPAVRKGHISTVAAPRMLYHLSIRPQRWRRQCVCCARTEVEPLANDPRAELVALARLAAAQATATDYGGCAFGNCYRDFPKPDHRTGRVVAKYLHGVRRRVLSIAKRTGADNPDELGELVWLIVEGIYAGASHPVDAGQRRPGSPWSTTCSRGPALDDHQCATVATTLPIRSIGSR